MDVQMTDGRARITVTRPVAGDVGFREIYVSVDGGRNAILAPGDSTTSEIEPGRHRVRAHNTLFRKTHEIEVRPGEHVHFVAVNRPGIGTFGPMAVLGAGLLYLTFKRVPGPPS
jgi:hypothetical protein